MDAVECMKAVTRMLKSGTIDCAIQKYISAQKKNDYEGMVEAAEQWATEHPAKTRQSEFLTLFPNVRTDDGGVIGLLPCEIGEVSKTKCMEFHGCAACRKAFWLEEVKE